MTHENKTPDRDLTDRIDALAAEADPPVEPRPPRPERCPNCIDEWHALPIRRNLVLLRQDYCGCADCDRALDAYDYATDTSEIVCPGSTLEGPIQPLEVRLERAGFELALDLVEIQVVTLLADTPPESESFPPPRKTSAIEFPNPLPYRATIHAYRLGTTWRGTDHVVVLHQPDTDGAGPQTVLFRYHPPGTPQPRFAGTFLLGSLMLTVLDDGSDAEGYRSAIDPHGIVIEIDDRMRPRYQVDGHIDPRAMVTRITGQTIGD
ncbi:hypothetical protein [Nocardia arizonensis]|uniref:hypothetical protein n=1 Tax=Nocardia arizonensis TaxID=1141647 RepID=UPI0006D27945|nr:hypothetical protein [Nocardia arizonensis]